MHQKPLDDGTHAGVIGQFKTIRRREILFAFFGILVILAGVLVCSLSALAGLGICGVGGVLICAAFGMRQDRQSTREMLATAGPAAIGPLIEALYFDRGADEDVVSEARTKTAAEIARLLGSASRQHLLTLTDQEAGCLYRPYANWSDDFPEYQLIVLDHLIACLDVRALPWVIRLLKSPSFSRYSNAVKQRALICRDLLIAQSANQKARSVLLRPSLESSPLLRPADGSDTDNSKLDPILLRPSSND